MESYSAKNDGNKENEKHKKQSKSNIDINKFERQLRDIQIYKFKNQVGFVGNISNESFYKN
tara:strand:+ start:272 stop:454 length:183 start_codon:yes stop_codon:yes gene_type:complete